MNAETVIITNNFMARKMLKKHRKPEVFGNNINCTVLGETVKKTIIVLKIRATEISFY